MDTRAKSLRVTDTLTMRERVKACIKENPWLSRSEIAELLKVRLSSVCGRVRELLDRREIQTIGEKWDDKSRRFVECLTCC